MILSYFWWLKFSIFWKKNSGKACEVTLTLNIVFLMFAFEAYIAWFQYVILSINIYLYYITYQFINLICTFMFKNLYKILQVLKNILDILNLT